MLPWASQLLFEPGVDQLDDAHAALDQPPGDQALVGERRRIAVGDTVRPERRLRFAADVEHLGRLAHHAAGDVERGDPRAEVGVARPQRGVALVHVAQHDLLELVQRHGCAGGRRSGIGSGPGMIRTP